SGSLLTTLGIVEEGFYSSDGTVTLTLAMNKVGDANGRASAGAVLNNGKPQTEQATDVARGTPQRTGPRARATQFFQEAPHVRLYPLHNHREALRTSRGELLSVRTTH